MVGLSEKLSILYVRFRKMVEQENIETVSLLSILYVRFHNKATGAAQNAGYLSILYVRF